MAASRRTVTPPKVTETAPAASRGFWGEGPGRPARAEEDVSATDAPELLELFDGVEGRRPGFVGVADVVFGDQVVRDVLVVLEQRIVFAFVFPEFFTVKGADHLVHGGVADVLVVKDQVGLLPVAFGDPFEVL